MFNIEFYTLESGKQPVAEFLDSLTAKMRAKAIGSLELLEEFGNQLKEPHSIFRAVSLSFVSNLQATFPESFTSSSSIIKLF